MLSIKKFVILVLVIFIHGYNSDALKILGIFPLVAKSHYIMGEELMKILAERGHQVDVVSHFPQKKPFPNYTDISIAGSCPSLVNNITFEDSKKFSGLSLRNTVEIAGTIPCNLLSHPELQKLLKKPKDSYDVVIVALFAAQCYIAFGQHFNAPTIGVVPSKMQDWLYGPFGNPFNTAYMGSMFSSFTQDMTFFERLGNTFRGTIVNMQFNYYADKQREHVEKYFGRKISSLQELYDDMSIVFVNSHFSLGEIKPTTPDIIDIGGLHITGTGQKLSPDLQKWLDDSVEGCIYITFGSMVRIETLPADKVESFYEMFRRIAPVRVLMKIAEPSLLPPNLPKNVKTLSWLPQVAVLKHKNIKAFITHGGLLGTQEAVAWGVPLVGMPLFGDQHTNVNNYVRKKIATALDVNTFDADSLTNAVKTVLKNPEYGINIKKISSLFTDRPMSAKATVIYWVEYVARHGNRLKSPGTKLTWWQFYLLDVYGVIFGSLFLTLYIIKKILQFSYRLIFSNNQNQENSKSSLKSKKEK